MKIVVILFLCGASALYGYSQESFGGVPLVAADFQS